MPETQALSLLPSTAPSHKASPPRLTGWGWCAVSANWKLVLESGQRAWWGESTQHRREEEGVGWHRVPIEVPTPGCWAGAAVAGHAKWPVRREGRQSGRGLWRASGCPSSGHGAWAQRGFGWSAHPPLLSWSCCPMPTNQSRSSGAPTLAGGQVGWGISQELVLWLSSSVSCHFPGKVQSWPSGHQKGFHS